MSDIEPIRKRLQFATKNVLNRNVMTMHRSDWESMIHEKGLMTHVESLSNPFTNVINEAQVVAVTACGYQNPDPGIDIVRRDDNDAPHIYNIDHYTVVQTYCQHSAYETSLNRAGVADSPQLQDCLRQYVFVVKNKPSKTQDHWATELPDRIKNARYKGELP